MTHDEKTKALQIQLKRTEEDLKLAMSTFNRLSLGQPITEGMARTLKAKMQRALKIQRNLLIGLLTLNDTPQNEIAERFELTVARISQIKSDLGITDNKRRKSGAVKR